MSEICKFSKHINNPYFVKFEKGFGNLSNIVIRNIPAKTIAGLDDFAKQNNLSREEYIRQLLDHHVMYAEVEGLHKSYELLVQEVAHDMITALNENTRVLDQFIEMQKEER